MKPRIFVSTVTTEFKTARTKIEHVLEFLGYEVEQQDIFGTEGGDLRQMLREKIDACDALIQLAGDSYGAEPPTIDPDYGRVSYTQFEFLYARLQGKKTYVLFAGPACQKDKPTDQLDLPRETNHPDPAAHQAELRDLQSAYRARLRSEGHLWHSPADDTALENSVLKLRNDSEQLRKEFKEWQKKLEDSQARIEAGHLEIKTGQTITSRRILVLAGLILLLGIGGVFAYRHITAIGSGVVSMEEQGIITVEKLEKVDKDVSELKSIYSRERDIMAAILGRANELTARWENMNPTERFDLALSEIASEQNIPEKQLRDLLTLYAERVAADPDAEFNDKYYTLIYNQSYDKAAQLAGSEAESGIARMKNHAARRQAAEAISAEAAKAEAAERKLVLSFLLKKANALEYTSDNKAAIAAYREAVSFAPDSWEAQNRLGKLCISLALWQDAEMAFNAALPLAEGVQEKTTSMGNLAALLQSTNRLSEAEPLMRRAIDLTEEAYGRFFPTLGISLNNLGGLLHATGRLSEAEPLYYRALAISEISFGMSDPLVATVLGNLARLLQATDRPADAEVNYKRAIAINEATFGKTHPEVATDLSNYASLLQATGKFGEAEKLYRRALAIDEAYFGGNHPTVAIRLNNLASLLYETDRAIEVAPLLRRVINISEASLGKNHPDVASYLINLGRLLKDLGRFGEAEPIQRRATIIFLRSTRESGHDHPKLTEALNDYIDTLARIDLEQEEGSSKVLTLGLEAGWDREKWVEWVQDYAKSK